MEWSTCPFLKQECVESSATFCYLFRSDYCAQKIATGLAASSSAATGRIVFSAKDAVELASKGIRCPG